jgi:arylsulfatase A-like enzyme
MSTVKKVSFALGFCFVAVFTTSAQSQAHGNAERGAVSPPNILFILTDDQGWGELGVHGNSVIETPNLDKLSRESMNFSHYYAAPVCSPTRAGLMTGRYHLRTGLYNTRFGGDAIDQSEITVAELLQKAGYRTGLFGKWHLGKYYGYQPNQRGFEEFYGHYNGHIDEYDYPDQLVHNGRPTEARRYVTDLFTDTALEFIEQNDERPFFCYLAYNAPHSPWVVGTSHARQERGDKLIKKYLSRGLNLRDARIYAMDEIIDENIGRLMERLAELGLAENTVVLFSSDNGGVSDYYSGGLRGKKGSVYEGGVRSPLFVRWPKHFPANTHTDAMVSHVDMMPTLCEIAGVSIPSDRTIDGKSLLPLLRKGGGASPHEYIFHHWDRYFPNPYNTWAVSDGRYKLLNNPSPWPDKPVPQTEPFGQLYDLSDDPGETRNLAGQHPEIVSRLRSAFLSYYQDVTAGRSYAPMPIPVGHPQENPVEIQPSWATLHGDSIRYTFMGYDWDTVEGWEKKGEYAEWNLNVAKAGRYEVLVSYGCSRRNSGGELAISTDRSVLNFVVGPTPSPDVFEKAAIGFLTLRQGKQILKVEVTKAANGEVIRLNKIWLRKI